MEHVLDWDYKQLDIHASQNLHFEFKDVNILLPFTVSQTFAAGNLCLSLFLNLILNNSIVFFSSSLNKLNVLSTFHKVMHINIAQNLQFRHCWIKVYSRYNHHVMASLRKILLLKWSLDLKLIIQNALLTDPIILII